MFPLLPLRPRFRLSLAHPLRQPIFVGRGGGGRLTLLIGLEGKAMKATMGVRRRWLWALCGAALGVATSGCSMLIAQSGVSGVGEVYKPAMRAEVRARFGEADEAGTCPDGRGMERRSIRRQVKWRCSGFAAEMGCAALSGAYQREHGAG